MNLQTEKGQSIEDASMRMIEDEIGKHDYNEKEWPIVRRIINSTADFDFAGIEKCEKDEPKVLVIVFYFLHEGAHVKNDINNDLLPALEKSSIKKSLITKHLGTDENMIDLIIERAKEVESAN